MKNQKENSKNVQRSILFSPPDISDLEIAEVVEALKSGWITTGPRTKELEKRLAGFCHTSKVVCLNSATAAEELNFRICGIGEGGNPSLKDINLHIKSGQTVGIIGGTGSAKSTLVQMIPRLYDVTGGAVKVAGVDVRDYNLEVLRDQVSMVLQKNVLFSGTIYDNIRWGNEHASDEEVKRVCRLAQADGFVNEFPNGYETMIVQGGNNVSGGQKQRLCIARALLKKPKILILDDSTSAVDTKTDALIRKAFREEIPDTTKIIIAQRVSSIEDADQIIVLDDGKIAGVGTSEELLQTNEIYREVYESQVKGGEEDE